MVDGYDRGWVKLYRKSADDIWLHPLRSAVFIYFLRNAAWKEKSMDFSGESIVLKPGQLIIGQSYLAERLSTESKITVYRVRRAIKYLHQRGTIVVLTKRRGTLITVVNWETYQADQIKSELSPNLTQIKTDTNEEEKKKRKKEYKAVRLDFSFLKAFIKGAGITEGISHAHKQIKSVDEAWDLNCAVLNYNEYCTLSQREAKYIRSLKRFIGSEKDGFFYKDFIKGIPEDKLVELKPKKKINWGEELFGDGKN